MTCKTVMLLITLLVADPIHAAVKELEAAGETYPILEENILAELRQQVMKADQFQDQIRKQIGEYQPGSIPHLPRTMKDRTFAVDMTYTVEEDIIDGAGRVIYPKGFLFNPLKYVSMPGGLLVIDGDDPRQVEWFKVSPYSSDRRVRLLLSNGQASDLIDRLKRPVFYLTEDIARRLQLAAVPSLVIQQEQMLQVHEIFLPPDTRRSDEDR